MGDLSSCGCNECNARSNNGCDNGCGSSRSGNSMWWIIILIFFCGCGNNNSGLFGLGNNSCGCGDNDDNGCCNILIWIILLSCICGNGCMF